MPTPLEEKSSVEQIRQRFDQDVERFSDLTSGQQSTIDAALVLDLISSIIGANLKGQSGALLDVGCGAGNFTLKILQSWPEPECHLVDLSESMLARAKERVSEASPNPVMTYQSDMRALSFPQTRFDVIVAAAVLHHLRAPEDWAEFFRKLNHWLKPGGLLFVWDLAVFDDPILQELMWSRYGKYLSDLRGAEYRDAVFHYIDQEDSPRSLHFQFDLLQRSGFTEYDVLHRNSVFAAYYARK